jgi:hypothetical protein
MGHVRFFVFKKLGALCRRNLGFQLPLTIFQFPIFNGLLEPLLPTPGQDFSIISPSLVSGPGNAKISHKPPVPRQASCYNSMLLCAESSAMSAPKAPRPS